MMYLSTTSNIMKAVKGEKKQYTLIESLDAIKEAGYDKVDISLWSYMGAKVYPGDEAFDRMIDECAEHSAAINLPVNQTHGNTPGNLEWDDPSYDWDYLMAANRHAVRATARLGGKWIVIHPKNLPREPLYSSRRGLEANLSYLAPVIEEAKKSGIGVAVENMVDFRNFRRRYCGGDIYELIELVDTINDPSVGICLDTGHANLAGIECGAAIREIGGRLKCTHINDNHDNGLDEHLFPYFGTIDWKDTMKALGEIGYEGELTYECGDRFIPSDLRTDWLKYTVSLGRELISLSKI